MVPDTVFVDILRFVVNKSIYGILSQIELRILSVNLNLSYLI